jgi:hypothetical protein
MLRNDETAEVILHSDQVHGAFRVPPQRTAPLTIAAASGEKVVVSGGISIPTSLFTPDTRPTATRGTLVASLTALNITRDDLGMMLAGSCVDDCQHNTSFLSFGGELMTLSRWPNVANRSSTGWQWAHASNWTDESPHSFLLDNTTEEASARARRWASEEPDAWLHGYWTYDWADCYRKLQSVTALPHSPSSALNVSFSSVAGDSSLETVKSDARFYGVNLLSELDAPGEYWIDRDRMLLYFYPPTGGAPIASPPVLSLARHKAVVNVSGSRAVTLRNLIIADGFAVGIDADGAAGLVITNVSVERVGQVGISLVGARDSLVSRSKVHAVGCVGIDVNGGDPVALKAGNLTVGDSTVYEHALWKRTYQPGIRWGGVSNSFVRNTVYNGAHNCFLGGGNEAYPAAHLNLFENNTLDTCAFEAADTGAFYSCGQHATAFTNRGNVLRGNTFRNIRNLNGIGASKGALSVQGIYLDDQMSGWLVENNRFINCTTGMFIGGGRDNIVRNSYFERCGTAVHLDARGAGWQVKDTNCSAPQPCKPGECYCNPAGAIWLADANPAVARRWPQMLNTTALTLPAFSEVVGNVHCGCTKFLDQTDEVAKAWHVTVAHNKNDTSKC